jgi:hypothetical protein
MIDLLCARQQMIINNKSQKKWEEYLDEKSHYYFAGTRTDDVRMFLA